MATRQWLVSRPRNEICELQHHDLPRCCTHVVPPKTLGWSSYCNERMLSSARVDIRAALLLEVTLLQLPKSSDTNQSFVHEFFTCESNITGWMLLQNHYCRGGGGRFQKLKQTKQKVESNHKAIEKSSWDINMNRFNI